MVFNYDGVDDDDDDDDGWTIIINYSDRYRTVWKYIRAVGVPT